MDRHERGPAELSGMAGIPRILAAWLAACLLATVSHAAQWVGAGPFATGLGDQVITALALTPDGKTAYAGTGSGTVFKHVRFYSVGGTVSGLASGKSLTLRDNGGDDLTLSGDGAFTFATKLPDGEAYEVTVAIQPAGQTCAVDHGSGTINSADITDVTVNCVVDTHTVGGGLTGLASGKSVTLRNNGGDDLTLSGNGAFTFATALTDGSAYAVTVALPPAGQTCSVEHGSGTIGGADVVDVAVSCVDTVVTGNNPRGAGSITAMVGGVPPGCGFSSAQFIAVPAAAASSAPPNLSFPYGMASITVSGHCGNGVTAIITLIYPNDLPANSQFWKYGRTADNPVDHWYPLTAASNNLVIAGKVVTYAVTDGGLGDDDYTPNGSIVDPAAPAVPNDAAGIPALSVSGFIVLAMLLALSAVIVLRRPNFSST